MTTAPQDPDVLELLQRAQEARRGRDLWRAVGPVLTSLIDEHGVSYETIEQLTGISSGTAHHHVSKARRSRTPDKPSSAAES